MAQNVVFTAQAGANKLGIQDQMQIVFTIQDAGDLSEMSYPANLYKEFNVVQGPYQGRSSNYSLINGKMTQSQSINVTYVVQPKHLGTINLAPATAKDVAGHTYQSNGLSIQVVQGSVAAQQQQRQRDPFWDEDPFEAIMRQRQQQMQAMRQQQQQRQQPQAAAQPSNVNLNKDLFIRVTVDKDKVHLGEQITATYKLYARLPMNCQISKLPSLNGFWTQDFEMVKGGNMKPSEEIIDGKKYQVFTLKKSALFPQQTGTLELDPAEAEGVARIMTRSNQSNGFGGMFDDPAFQNAFGSLMMSDPFFNDAFFGGVAYQDVKVNLKSKPIKITVTPLPDEGKPDNFTNAVGNFSISSSIDKTSLSTDDVANLKLTITGSGNLKLIEAPKLNLPNGLSYLDPTIVDTITGRTTTISGSKIITYPITPNTAGEFEIPPIPFTFFNSQTGKYVTVNTSPYKLNVKQGKGSPISKNSALVRTDIHTIDKSPLPQLTYNSKPLLYSVGYWSLYALPLTAFIGLAVWRRRENELSKDIVGLRNRRANKVALKRLATAQQLLAQKNQKAFYDEISKAIWLYLSDKLNIQLSELSHERANESLTMRNVPIDLQHKAERVIHECETALYAGYSGTDQMNHTYNEAIDVISKLEDCFKA
jgi:hypothetical protein